MTRKHFEAIAAAFRMSRPGGNDGREADAAYDQWQEDVARVADVLADTNPSFDRGRFWTACHA